jgi:hypothetical protein
MSSADWLAILVPFGTIMITSIVAMVGFLAKRSMDRADQTAQAMHSTLKGISNKMDEVIIQHAVLQEIVDWLKDMHRNGASHMDGSGPRR